MIDFILNFFRGRQLGGRSPKWSQVRKQHLELYPLCAVCDRKGTLLKSNEVHHIKSFATHPELELAEDNLITGCREHHLWFYHLGSWQSLNENIKEDVALWSKKITNRPKWNGKNWIYPKII